MTNQKKYSIEQVGEMQTETYKLSRYRIALKQILFYMKNSNIKEDYYKNLNHYFMIKPVSNENAKQMLEATLKQHKDSKYE